MKLYGQTTSAQTGYVRQSYAGIIRQRLIAIERTIGHGVRHEAIRQMLIEEGHSASIGTFRKSLSRARIWWRVQLLQLQLEQQSGKQTQNGSEHISATVNHHPSALQARRFGKDNTNHQVQPHQYEHGPQTHDSAATQATYGTQSQGASQKTIPSPKPDIDLDAFFKPKSVFVKPGQ